MSDARYTLETGLDRLGTDAGGRPHSFTNLEWDLVDSFIRSARGLLRQQPKTHWEHVAIAQHYGLPTRLLDWTFSPLVALHFAVDPIGDRDRAVWVLDWAAMHRGFGLLDQPADADALENGFEEGSILDAWYPESGETRSFCCLFQPPAIDARIVAQSGVFTLSSETALPLDDFLVAGGKADLLTKIVIPGQACDALRLELSLHGIHAGSLFPDLGGVARGIKSRFTEHIRQNIAHAGNKVNAKEVA